MTLKNNKKYLPKSFLIFLVVSVFFWMLTKLSKEYDSSLYLRSNYINMPINKVLIEDLPKSILVNVKASGFKLFYAELFPLKVKIETSNLEKRDKNLFTLDLDLQESKIQKQLPKGVLLNYFESPKINMVLDELEQKKVKIEPNVVFSFKDNYDKYGKETLIPDSILISGPKKVLDSLQVIRTKRIEFNNADEDISANLSIDPIYKKLAVVYESNSIIYNVEVSKFTEATLNLPFSIINYPSDKEITTFPSMISITFKVGLKDYEKVNPNLFLIECDFQQSLDNNLDFLIPKIVSSPNFIKNLKLNNQRIDFFIKK